MIPALIAALTLSQIQFKPPIRPRVFRSDGAPRISRLGSDDLSFAFFEAFPANGAGTTGPCSTSAPTSAQNNALTFTRGSNGTCTLGVDGLRTTGIANGDLVVLASNIPRQMYDAPTTERQVFICALQSTTSGTMKVFLYRGPTE